jgi:hypothetical protein
LNGDNLANHEKQPTEAECKDYIAKLPQELEDHSLKLNLKKN